MEYTKITPEVAKYMAVIPYVKTEIVGALQRRAEFLGSLATRMSASAGVVTRDFPDVIDPLVAMHVEVRHEEYEINEETKLALLEILAILDVAVTLELECKLGEEEMLQALAVIGACLRPGKYKPHLQSVPLTPAS